MTNDTVDSGNLDESDEHEPGRGEGISDRASDVH